MASIQVKIERGVHEEVKEFVDQSEKYSGYKAFYEEAARRELERHKKPSENRDLEEIKEMIIEDLNLDQ